MTSHGPAGNPRRCCLGLSQRGWHESVAAPLRGAREGANAAATGQERRHPRKENPAHAWRTGYRSEAPTTGGASQPTQRRSTRSRNTHAINQLPPRGYPAPIRVDMLRKGTSRGVSALRFPRRRPSRQSPLPLELTRSGTMSQMSRPGAASPGRNPPEIRSCSCELGGSEPLLQPPSSAQARPPGTAKRLRHERRRAQTRLQAASVTERHRDWQGCKPPPPSQPCTTSAKSIRMPET